MTTKSKGVIHIAPDIGYLFPEEAADATVYCGRKAQEVLASGEWVGVEKNLNPDCETCLLCLMALAQSKGMGIGTGEGEGGV